jgi:pyridinium-3,5-biscarboxylic acid mononucleotide synthase
MFDAISGETIFHHGQITYHTLARIISINPNIQSADASEISRNEEKKRVVVATAGTTDITVAEEAAVILEASNVPVDRIYDVGVAGLHRILAALPKLTNPQVGCIIVCAGMDGALPSVVGGLVPVPVIAVPTSVGYGASFSGVSALLTMLNSCAPGVCVMNIDNGFGAAAFAYKCLQLCKQDSNAPQDE